MKRLLLAAALAVTPGIVDAHDWYPQECCSGQDCAPVDHVEWVAGSVFDARTGETSEGPPVMVVTSKVGTVAVPPNQVTRPSHDGQMHVCIWHGMLLCLFVPPNT